MLARSLCWVTQILFWQVMSYWYIFSWEYKISSRFSDHQITVRYLLKHSLSWTHQVSSIEVKGQTHLVRSSGVWWSNSSLWGGHVADDVTSGSCSSEAFNPMSEDGGEHYLSYIIVSWVLWIPDKYNFSSKRKPRHKFLCNDLPKWEILALEHIISTRFPDDQHKGIWYNNVPKNSTEIRFPIIIFMIHNGNLDASFYLMISNIRIALLWNIWFY